VLNARAREGTLGGSLAYRAVGDGPPVVFLRTIAPTARNPTGLARWSELRLLRRLADRFTAYAVGRRPGLRPGVTMGDLAAHVAEGIASRFDQPVDVLGVSTSGSLALQLAADHPHLVRRLVVVAASCRLGAAGREMQLRYAERLTAGPSRASIRALVPGFVESRLARPLVSAVLPVFTPVPEDPAGMVAMLMAEDGFDLESRLAEITAPTLLVGGELDRFYPPDLVRLTAAGIPGARLQLHPGRSHSGVLRASGLFGDVLAFLLAS
jgi:pimeloyl-ACP methyl ester carboxylesterase